MIAAIVPAAGSSVRMGRPKLALPLGDSTILEHVITTLCHGGVQRIVVVIGPQVCDLATLATAAGADVCQLDEETADMRETVLHGFRWLEQQACPSPNDAWLLAPGDQPMIQSHVVRELIAGFEREARNRIVVPVFGARRGHPVLIPWRHVPGIRSLPPGQGISAYLREHAAETLELPVDNAGILHDVDTPVEYQRLLDSITNQQHADGNAPDCL